MSKKKKHNHSKKKNNWTPPKNYRDYFDPSSDDEFKAAHPIGYFFLMTLGMVALLLPSALFYIVGEMTFGRGNGWLVLGLVGGFIFGIGLFNFVAIIIKQYLGHWVSIISFLIGGAMMFISWLLCR